MTDTPEVCPTCGSKDRAVRHTQFIPALPDILTPVQQPCQHSWHDTPERMSADLWHGIHALAGYSTDEEVQEWAEDVLGVVASTALVRHLRRLGQEEIADGNR